MLSALVAQFVEFIRHVEHPAPAVAEAAAKAASAEETINEAKAAYLPRLDAVWQLNRATGNNVFGLLLEVLGPLKAGDIVVKRGTDEIRDGLVIKKRSRQEHSVECHFRVSLLGLSVALLVGASHVWLQSCQFWVRQGP